MAPATAPSDKSKPWIPLASKADDGSSKEGQATATCYCGAVQLLFVSRTLNSLRLCAQPHLSPGVMPCSQLYQRDLTCLFMLVPLSFLPARLLLLVLTLPSFPAY